MTKNGPARMAKSTEARIEVLEHGFHEIRSDVNEIRVGMRELLKREAQRPEPTSIKNIMTSAVLSMSMMASMAVGFNWWFDTRAAEIAGKFVQEIEQNTQLRREWTQTGKIYRLVDRVERLESAISWTPTITKD